MPNNQINAKIVSRNDTKTNWTTNNPKPLKGELCIEFDPSAVSNDYIVRAKVGDGVNYYNDLPYLAGQLTVDGKSITINQDGQITINGFDDAEPGQFPVKKVSNNVESIDWVTIVASDIGAIPSTDKGVAGGVATLDANTGKVPPSQLPSYVDDVVEGYYNTIDGKFYEESTYTTEITAETGKIYISLDTDKSYRWSGSTFVAICDPLALGTTHDDAYYGDLGNTAYLHSQTTHAPENAERNVIVGVQVDSVDLTVDSNRKVNIPIAATSALGVVKSTPSNADNPDNKVAVGNDGTMTINKVTTDKLKNGSDTLVFICGDSSS